jgi:uncharacterized protein YdhG (YjbR/CyaY superfamily)
MSSAPKDIDTYLAGFPAETVSRLSRIREIVGEMAPDATETISYGVPTFDLAGKHLVHFAGYPRHIGMYPVFAEMDGLPEDLRPYLHGRGTVRFPLSEQLPEDLVRWVVQAQLQRLGGERRK